MTKEQEAIKELIEALKEVMCWYSSGFAPQSQANAAKRAHKAISDGQALIPYQEFGLTISAPAMFLS